MKTLTLTIGLLFFVNLNLSAQGLRNQITVETSTEDCIATIIWEATTEVNTSYFIIERFNDDSSFTQVGSVAASGSTTGKETYTFEDVTIESANAIYRVTMVCMDGTKYAAESQPTIAQGFAQSDSE